MYSISLILSLSHGVLASHAEVNLSNISLNRVISRHYQRLLSIFISEHLHNRDYRIISYLFHAGYSVRKCNNFGARTGL